MAPGDKATEIDWPATVKVATEDGWFDLPGGQRAYFKTWKAQPTVKAKLIAIHGFSDHCNTYNDLFSTLASRGIEVASFDQRGWGKTALTPAGRGASGTTDTVLSDIEAFAKRNLPEDGSRPHIPTFLFGHSMGGQQTIHAAHSLPRALLAQLRGYVVFSPLCGLHPSTTPSPVTVFVGRLAAKVVPRFHMHQPLNEEFLTRDKAKARLFAQDRLCHDYGTLEGLAGMLDRMEEIGRGECKVEAVGTQGIWVAHGRADRVCDCAATERWFKEDCGIEDRTLRIFEGAYHRLNDELEPTRSEFIQEMGDWILDRAATSG